MLHLMMLAYAAGQAELESRMDMLDAQVEKLQIALERADGEKAKVEEQLEEARTAAAPSASPAAPPAKVCMCQLAICRVSML